MKQILLELDLATAAELDKIAPARSRKRSEFVRMAIRKAIWDLQEQETAKAYARMPQEPDEGVDDPDTWEKEPPPETVAEAKAKAKRRAKAKR